MQCKFIRFLMILTIFLTLLLTGCDGNKKTPTTQEHPEGIKVDKIQSPKISKTWSQNIYLPNCEGNSDLVVKFSQQATISQSATVGGKVTISAGASIDIPAAVKAELNTAIEGSYTDVYGNAKTLLNDITMAAKPGTSVTYVIQWEEHAYQSDVSYILNGINNTNPYTYTLTVPNLGQSINNACPTQSPTITPSPMPSPTIAPSPTPSPTFTPTPEILFYEDFLDNNKGWDIFTPSSDGPRILSKIRASKYIWSIDCPQTYVDYYCGESLIIPYFKDDNFELNLDETIDQITPYTDVMIGVLFRKHSTDYYAAGFYTSGIYTIKIFYNNKIDLLVPVGFMDQFYNEKVGINNLFGIINDYEHISIYVNGNKLAYVDDGLIMEPGNVFLNFYVSRGGNASISINSIKITRVP